MSELWRKGAVELAKLISDREVSSREVVQAHLDRVEAVNPHLNAIVRLLPGEEGAEERLREVLYHGPASRCSGSLTTAGWPGGSAPTPPCRG